MKLKLPTACLLALTCVNALADARDTISVVGSSTVFPFAKVVAERFGRATPFKSPTVEATGSGGGFKEFCGGLGVSHPDISNASRRIKGSELAYCRRNGVDDIMELLIGYDGIVLASSVRSPTLALSRREIFLALADKVPAAADGGLIKNPNRLWSDVDPALPATPILVYGPPTTSGTRDAYVDLVMEGGCRTLPAMRELEREKPGKFKRLCHVFRDDGAFIEVGENDNIIVQKLKANPDALGILGFSFLDQNRDKIQAASIDGVAPDFDTIASGDYPISRPLYLYVKKAHLDMIPGMRGYLSEFTSAKAWGDEGYLSDKGMVPLSAVERAEVASRFKDGTTLGDER